MSDRSAVVEDVDCFKQRISVNYRYDYAIWEKALNAEFGEKKESS